VIASRSKDQRLETRMTKRSLFTNDANEPGNTFELRIPKFGSTTSDRARRNRVRPQSRPVFRICHGGSWQPLPPRRTQLLLSMH